MQVKNKKSGETEFMRYGPAMSAVEAGTHEIVNEKAGTTVEPAETADLDKMTKDELLAEAERRGVEVKSSDTKAEIVEALEAK